MLVGLIDEVAVLKIDLMKKEAPRSFYFGNGLGAPWLGATRLVEGDWEDDLPLDMAERDCGVVLLHCKYLEVPILLTSSS